MNNEFGKPNGIQPHGKVSHKSSRVHRAQPYRIKETSYYICRDGTRRKRSRWVSIGVSIMTDEVNWEEEWETNYSSNKIGKHRSKL